MVVGNELSSGSARMPLKHLGFAVVVFGLWELFGRTADEYVLPPVSDIVVAFYDITVQGALIPSLAESLQLLGLGFLCAVVLGIVLGTLIGRSRIIDRTLSPYLNGLYAAPDIALLPLILVWFGFGLTGRVVIVFIAAFFPIVANVYAGMRQAPGDLIEVGRSFGVKGELATLRRIIFPAATPYIATGIRLAIGRAIVGMAVAEVFLAVGGIGGLIVEYGGALQLDYMIAAILPLPALGIGLTKTFGLLERRLEAWRTV